MLRGIYAATEIALLETIRIEPGEDSYRLIYADWLRERGDRLGNFIRIQCRIHAFWDNQSFYPAYVPMGMHTLKVRELRYIKRYGEEWRSPLPPWARFSHFTRGFPMAAMDWPIGSFRQMSDADLARSCKEMNQRLMIGVTAWPKSLAELTPLFRSPVWRYARSLSILPQEFEPKSDLMRMVEILSELPGLGRLESLTFATDDLPEEGKRLAARLLH
jgi:uncharacterized protein (TIGR02996 family)